MIYDLTHDPILQETRSCRIFHLLWETNRKFQIPHSIVLKDGKLTKWYFTSKQSKTIKRKRQSKMNDETILQTFRQIPGAMLYQKSQDRIIRCFLNPTQIQQTLANFQVRKESFLLQSCAADHTVVLDCRYTAASSPDQAPFVQCVRLVETNPIESRTRKQATASSSDYDAVYGHPFVDLTSTNSGQIVIKHTRRLVRLIEEATKASIIRLVASFVYLEDEQSLVYLNATEIVFAQDLSGEIFDVNACGKIQKVKFDHLSAKFDCKGGFCSCQVEKQPNNTFNSAQNLCFKSFFFARAENKFLLQNQYHQEASLHPKELHIQSNNHQEFNQLLENRNKVLHATIWAQAFKEGEQLNSDRLVERYKTVMGQISPSRLYEQVSVCPTCYRVYQLLDTSRTQQIQRRIRSESSSSPEKTLRLAQVETLNRLSQPFGLSAQDIQQVKVSKAMKPKRKKKAPLRFDEILPVLSLDVIHRATREYPNDMIPLIPRD